MFDAKSQPRIDKTGAVGFKIHRRFFPASDK